jgi:hypothetical protein
MAYVAEHPELETQPDPGSYATQYGQYGSLADLLRQIGHDERTHKLDSLINMRTPRFRDPHPRRLTPPRPRTPTPRPNPPSW